MGDKERTLMMGLMDLTVDVSRKLTALIIERALNDIYAADPDAVHALMETRVPCNKKIETDTLAVPFAETPDGPLSLGPLGVLNAVIGLHGLLLVGLYDNKTKKLTGFVVEVKKNGDAPK